MFKPSRKLTRPPIKHSMIVNTLRDQIVSGVFLPGSQLPTRSRLETRFGVSRVTLQRALEQLMADGFVCARGRHGTFVADHPPHLSCYGLVFHHRPPPSGNWSRFLFALNNEALAIDRAGLRRMSVFYGPESPADESYLKLVDEVQRQRLAGLIFTSPPTYLKGAPPLEQPGLPRVAIMKTAEFPGIPAVNVDSFSFIDKALEYLNLRRRKNIAVLLGSHTSDYREYLAAGMRRRGMNCPPFWIQSVNPATGESARNCTHLLMHKGQVERPDGLLIADDNLVEHATAGLAAAAVDVPTQVDVVVHCNFPWPTPSLLPVKRLGYDIRHVLNTCLRYIDGQRRGEKIPEVALIPAIFEDEVKSNSPSLINAPPRARHPARAD